MSLKCTKLVWEKAQVNSTTLLVLLCLADYADDTNRCFPSQTTIAKQCRMCDRNVRGILKRLETDGLIERVSRGNIAHSTTYRICVEQFTGLDSLLLETKQRQILSSRKVSASRKDSSGSTGKFTSNTGKILPKTPAETFLRSIIDPSLDPPLNHYVVEKPKIAGMNHFQDFWKSYPKKQNKGDAMKAWKTGKCDKHIDAILQSLEKHKVWQDWTKDGGKFIPHPATWLRRLGWENELEIKGLSTPGIAVGSADEWA